MATAAAAPAKKWAREYETIYILRPDVDDATAEKIVSYSRAHFLAGAAAAVAMSPPGLVGPSARAGARKAEV